MVLSIYLQNVDGASLDAIAHILSHLHGKPPIASLSTLLSSDSPHFATLLKSDPLHSDFSNWFRLDPPPLDHEKMDEELVDKFL